MRATPKTVFEAWWSTLAEDQQMRMHKKSCEIGFYASTMTLRDCLAGMAMQGLRSSEGFKPDCPEVAEYSYRQADEMITARLAKERSDDKA